MGNSDPPMDGCEAYVMADERVVPVEDLRILFDAERVPGAVRARLRGKPTAAPALHSPWGRASETDEVYAARVTEVTARCQRCGRTANEKPHPTKEVA